MRQHAIAVLLAVALLGGLFAVAGTASAQDELEFNDQELEDGEVTVENVSTDQESTIAVTYTDGDNETIAGLAPADNLDSEDVQVAIEDAGGFPGFHTAWLFDDDDVPAGVGIGDDATPIAGDALDSDSANVTQAPTVELTFNNQALSDAGTVIVGGVQSAGEESAVVVTYENTTEEPQTEETDLVIAGLEVGTFDDENVAVDIEDAGGFPGDHVAHIVPVENLSTEYEPGDFVSVATADEILDNEAATVFDTELTFEDQSYDGETSEVIVETATLLDGAGNETEFVIDLHPTDEAGNIIGTEAVGQSDNLTGANSDVVVSLDEPIAETDDFVAMLHEGPSSEPLTTPPILTGDGDELVPIVDGATVTVEEAAPEMSLSFSEQGIEAQTVTVDDVDSDGTDATVVITYEDGNDTVVAGLTDGVFDNETVEVELDDLGGFPGNHTAHILPSEAVSNDTADTGVVSEETLSAILDNEEAFVSVDATGDGVPARDTTGDGLLNDINGDGEFSIADVQALFMNLNSPSVQNNAQLFDFAGANPDRVNVFDVQGLFTELQAQQAG